MNLYKDISLKSNIDEFRRASKTIEGYTKVFLSAQDDVTELIDVLSTVNLDKVKEVLDDYEGDTRVVNSIRRNYLEMLYNKETITKEMVENEILELKSKGKHNWNSFKLMSGLHWRLFDVSKDEEIISSHLEKLLINTSQLEDFKHTKIFSMQGSNNQGASYYGYCVMKNEFKANSVPQLVYNISDYISVYCYDPATQTHSNETLIDIESATLNDDIVAAFIYASESEIIKNSIVESPVSDIDNCNFFTMRTGRKNNHYKDFVDNRIISFSWKDMQSVEGLAENDIKQFFSNTYGVNSYSQFNNFKNEMKIGDIVLILRSGFKVADIAVITGDVTFNENHPSRYRYYRTVEILAKEVEFDFIFTIQPTITKIRNTDRIEQIKEKLSHLNDIYLKAMTNIETSRDLNFKYFDQEISDADSQDYEFLNNYKQIIIDGAPGTGKSYGVQKEIKANDIIHERVTFYSDYEYYNFVGSILPVLNSDNNLEYKFVQGPFTKLLDESLSNPEEKHYLVIEELTRGNAAAIFGDIFQLLDRDDNGFSEYPISNDNIFNSLQPEVQEFLISNYKGKIILPPNFSIICTINSSDQNVFPLDTAFKRRFDYKIESTKPAPNFEDFTFSIGEIDNISWTNFYQQLNTYILEQLNLKEDKQVGPYFIKNPKDDPDAIFAIQTKLAMYLWNDLHKVYTGSSKSIFTNIHTLADVSNLFVNGTRMQLLAILTDDFKKHFNLNEDTNEY